MKTIFIPSKTKSVLNQFNINSISKELPKNLFLAYSIQYKELSFKIKEILSKDKEIKGITQVLGCSKLNLSKEVQAILLISDGKFHAISLAKELEIPVYILTGNKLQKISEKEVELLKKKKQGAYLRFLNADKIGILISTKPGQQRLQRALDFKKNLNKKSYLFLGNNINVNEFENFGLDSWVNTSCPRLDFDSSKIVNMNEIQKDNKKSKNT
jgi:diphthamide biosynthesis enzyme Dph1/Dph2-like protein